MLLRPSGVFVWSRSAPVSQHPLSQGPLSQGPLSQGPVRQLPFRRGVRLAVDVGSVRVGVARSDPGGVLATPLTVLSSGPGAKAELARTELARLVASEGAIEGIVGVATP